MRAPHDTFNVNPKMKTDLTQGRDFKCHKPQTEYPINGRAAVREEGEDESGGSFVLYGFLAF